MADENVQLGWRIPPAVRDKFKEYCDDVGSDYGDSLAAAMTIWQHLPASIQRQSHLEVAGKQGVDQKFWEELRRGLDDAILDRVHRPKGR